MNTQTTYVIREVSTGKTPKCDANGWGAYYTDTDGKARANELVEIHNRHYGANTWGVKEEQI